MLVEMFQVNFGTFDVFTCESAPRRIEGWHFSISKQNFLTYIEEKRSMITCKSIEEWFVNEIDDPIGNVWWSKCVINCFGTTLEGFEFWMIRIQTIKYIN